MSNVKIDTITKELELLPEEMQVKLKDFIHILSLNFPKQKNMRKITDFAGGISDDDLEIIEKSINEECEKVDRNDW